MLRDRLLVALWLAALEMRGRPVALSPRLADLLREHATSGRVLIVA